MTLPGDTCSARRKYASAWPTSPSVALHLPALISAMSADRYSGLRTAASNSGMDSRARPVWHRYQP